MKKIYTLCILLLLLFSCTQLPDSDFYESEGIISMDARSMSFETGWAQIPYNSSLVVKSLENEAVENSSLSATVYVQSPGKYSLWLLSTRFSRNADNNTVPIRVTNSENYLIHESQVQLPDTEFLKWTNREHQSDQELFVEFDEPGQYRVHILSEGVAGYKIDKLHLSLEGERNPSGRAYPATTIPGVDPVLAKRDQPKVIPPAWAFGTLMGLNVQSEEDVSALKTFIENGAGFDSFWIDENLIEEGEIPFSAQFDKSLKSGLNIRDYSMLDNSEDQFDSPQNVNLDFILTENKQNFEDVKTAFQFVQNKSEITDARGFLLSPYNVIYESDFKQYPAIRSTTLEPQNQELEVENGIEFGMRALRKNIKMVSGARYSLYEVPFIAPEITWPDNVENDLFSEELFIRWIQFAAFNSIFHITGFNHLQVSELADQLTDRAERQLIELTRLRNRLFPYIYSKAHLIRAGGVKPVRAIGERTTQFKLGEAFLLAPIYTEGADQRTVYLPEGRWYDYWSGRQYQGGQSWVVEASLDRIPVFVRAGSIIPYREFSGHVMDGTNERLKIEVYGDGASSFRLYETDGKSTAYQRGDFSTTAFRYFEHDDYATFTIGRMVRGYEDQPESKELNLVFKYVDEPSSILVDNQILERGDERREWNYDEETRTLYLLWDQPNYEKTDFMIHF